MLMFVACLSKVVSRLFHPCFANPHYRHVESEKHGLNRSFLMLDCTGPGCSRCVCGLSVVQERKQRKMKVIA